MSVKKGWLPREGFTADVVQKLVQTTLLNPVLTLPLLLLARYTYKGQHFALDHPTVIRRLKFCLYLGLARWANGILNRGALDNWQTAEFNWSQELVVVTGGSDGFGKLLVQYFAKKGVKVVILDIQEPTYELPNSNIHFISVDLCSPTAIAAASATLKSQYGNPTVLILNAGVAHVHTVISTPDHLLERLFAVNTLSHYRLAREFLPHMISRNHGMVVTIASLAASVTPSGMTDYCGSKAAAVSFHEGLTAELRDRHAAPKIRTICVCPNFAATKLAEGFKNDSKFVSPTLKAETVAEAIFEKIMTGTSGFVVLPRTAEWLVLTVRAMPWWWQRLMSGGLKEVTKGLEENQRQRELERKAEEKKEVVKAGE